MTNFIQTKEAIDQKHGLGFYQSAEKSAISKALIAMNSKVIFTNFPSASRAH